MLLESLREEVLDANLELVRRGLVLYTFGNVSGISRPDGLIAIKPSGVPYESMKAQDIVISDLDGRRVTTLGSPRLATLIGQQMELAYSRIDADGSLREVRITAVDAL